MSGQWPDRNNRNLQGIEKFVTWLALLVLLLLYWGYAWAFERVDFLAAPPGWWTWLINRFPLFDALEAFILIPAEFFSWSVLRHFIPILLAAWMARRAVYYFLETFYGLQMEGAGKVLLDRLRSWTVPNEPGVSLDAQNITGERGDNPILTVGGPARVYVERGTAIVTELNGHFARVLGPGTQFLARFEYPVQTIDLRPQDRHTDDARMMTKDGIDVTASVGVTFHIMSNDQAPSHETPFPFDRLSARRAAYAQTVMGDGLVGDWKSSSLKAAESALAEIVAESRLDELAHPMQGGIQPYPSRNRQMRKVTRANMEKQGVTVTDTRLGRLELPGAVLEKYLEYWRVYWEKRRRLEEVEGQAALIEETEIAEAKANALMFQATLDGLQRARQADQDEISRRVVALRLIEALQAMAMRSQDVTPLPDQLIVSLADIRRQLLEDGRGEESTNQMMSP
jgi:regulator of protease activity HflC (stomatin/prohibitin superfamily)